MAEKNDEWSEEITQRFELRVSPSFLTVIDNWRRQQPDIPSRAESIRRMVLIAAAKAEKGRPRK
jgi:hypothetical protein